MSPREFIPWTLRSSKTLFKSAWFTLRQDELTLPSGAEITYTVVDHPGYALCIPLLEDGRAVMIEVHRHTVAATLLECPAGGLDGDLPEVAARRELEEETGYRCGQMTKLGSFYGSPGSSNEKFHVFLATDLSRDGIVDHEETEQIRVVTVDFESLCAQAVAGSETLSAPTCLAILLARSRIQSDPGLMSTR